MCQWKAQVDDWGSWGYVAYTVVYTALELVIIPAIPLTMASGALFGVVPGVIVVSLASTAAAALGFLITRYAARDKVCSSMQIWAGLQCCSALKGHIWVINGSGSTAASCSRTCQQCAKTLAHMRPQGC